ncbi:MAG: dihydrodipicolinate synthase family protein [Phycisphaerales bacterium]|nr:dihydrodipicolinate synthase family protein [Hyphomonadaceae bacterium]
MSEIAHGAWSAALTPLNADLSIDHAAYGAHVDWLLNSGCAGVAALGTTGEANSFSLAERLDLIERLGKSGHASERILVGVGCCAAPDTIELTRASLGAGFNNVMMLAPFYYKNVSDEGVFRAYARVIEAVNDPRLNVIVYDIPPMTGLKIGVDLLRRLRDAFPGIVIGVKNSSGDWSAMEAALGELPGFKVFAGSEQFLLQTLRAGGPGCISATANITSRSLAELYATWRSDAADALQAAATRNRIALQKYPPIPALKEMMAAVREAPAWRRLRPPLANLAPADAEALLASVRELGLDLSA